MTGDPLVKSLVRSTIRGTDKATRTSAGNASPGLRGQRQLRSREGASPL